MQWFANELKWCLNCTSPSFSPTTTCFLSVWYFREYFNNHTPGRSLHLPRLICHLRLAANSWVIHSPDYLFVVPLSIFFSLWWFLWCSELGCFRWNMCWGFSRNIFSVKEILKYRPPCHLLIKQMTSLIKTFSIYQHCVVFDELMWKHCDHFVGWYYLFSASVNVFFFILYLQ